MNGQGEQPQSKTRKRRHFKRKEFQDRVTKMWHRLRHWLRLDELSPGVRKILVGFVGGMLLLAGVAMIFLPGPAFIVIPLALALLGSEFVWAKRCIQKGRTLLKKLKQATVGSR